MRDKTNNSCPFRYIYICISCLHQLLSQLRYKRIYMGDSMDMGISELTSAT
ncbi:16729_t:CDS:2 [Cetraspora pellucida]|uniref:16729_t:CDS:1 n=1 Tax=Cetraspora pellucida TaxID=1433469 RepID=A0A9N8WNQ8_9GLOM|nr:16729_t:CDS:2 [Cetraspora pellucida]